MAPRPTGRASARKPPRTARQSRGHAPGPRQTPRRSRSRPTQPSDPSAWSTQPDW